MRGHDIVMDVPVTVGEAVAGARVEAHDIDGETVTFKVPAGSSSGAEIRVSGKGVQSATAGDLIGCVQIRVPAKPGLGAKHAAKEFDKSVEATPKRLRRAVILPAASRIVAERLGAVHHHPAADNQR